MPDAPRLHTDRLLLREWRVEDRAPFAAMNADPRVAAWLSRPLDRAASDAFMARITAYWARDGFGLWALERVGDGRFVGMTGLSRPAWAPEPSVEVGWRLVPEAWGHGYATEAARAALQFGFEVAGLDAIVSYTSALNVRSRAVMERIGMARDPGADFAYEGYPEGHSHRPHVTYRISRAAWLAGR